ncbi:MAG: uroporphyrinogen decarboxylase family protein [Kiritimatiellae bacterium]|nr:uroporphyrinogen decarboxylase family protein [Kiritimatiellia bacterium]MDD5520244.1 uroporphyrinogen decarboxylase family protein [Kiritimatiellia bacterium]
MDFTPSIYEHAAALIGKTPLEVSRNGDLLFQAHSKAFQLYGHTPVIVGIDIYNLEAEAYGAIVSTPKGNDIPAICTHICQNTAEIRNLKPFNPEIDGRIPMVLETGRRLAKTLSETDIKIPLSGPFSLASNLVGFERLLCDILDDPESVKETLLHLAKGQIEFCREVIAQGLDIAFFESAATPPLISPEMFAQVELPALKFIIRETSSIAGHPVPCIIGGDTLPILDSILDTGTGYVICPCETNQELFMKKIQAYPEIMVRINTTPNGFASGDMASVYGELDRVFKLAVQREKVCIGTGALPFETKPDTVLKAKTYVQSWKRT